MHSDRLWETLRFNCLFVFHCLSYFFFTWQSCFYLPVSSACHTCSHAHQLPSLPFLVFYPSFFHYISGSLHYFLPFLFIRAGKQEFFLPAVPVSYWFHAGPCFNTSVSLLYSLSDFLGWSREKWHILAVGAVAAVPGGTPIMLAEGSLISVIVMIDTLHLQDGISQVSNFEILRI